ncbi:hypothetical protein D3C77_464360 [compost metagenome]
MGWRDEFFALDGGTRCGAAGAGTDLLLLALDAGYHVRGVPDSRYRHRPCRAGSVATERGSGCAVDGTSDSSCPLVFAVCLRAQTAPGVQPTYVAGGPGAGGAVDVDQHRRPVPGIAPVVAVVMGAVAVGCGNTGAHRSGVGLPGTGQ